MGKDINISSEEIEELFKQEKFGKIISSLTDEKLERQKDAVLYAWKAITCLYVDEYIAVAMVYAEKAIASDPFCSIGYFARASVWVKRNEYDKAIQDYTKAIELNLDFANAYFYRGLAWRGLNKNKEAIDDFDRAVDNYEKAIEANKDDAYLYIYCGNAYYSKGKNIRAKDYYTRAINLDQNFTLAYYNRGLANFALKKYDDAIADYNKAISSASNNKNIDVYYNERANAWKAKKEYKKAIDDYTRAINENKNFENAYYYRGLERIQYLDSSIKNRDSEEDLIRDSEEDFKKYLELISEEDDIGFRYAKYYLKELKNRKDKDLSEIVKLISKIKDILRVSDEEYITHYTSLSALRSLIHDSSKFRISEGTFMNDPSEGKEFFNFLGYHPEKNNNDSVEQFSCKFFIGSFVPGDMNNDLSMWRFYGKEAHVEAKGCAIVLQRKKFINDIKDSLSNEKNMEARIGDESDINLYRVAYMKHGANGLDIPDSIEKNKLLGTTMNTLKNKIVTYKKNNNQLDNLNEYLNSIAFLFKRDDYKNEKEVRLVMNGLEFKKKFNYENKSFNSPRVYIELVKIKGSGKQIVKQIILGPNVDKAEEWASALRYCYKEKEDVPEIIISRLPYK